MKRSYLFLSLFIIGILLAFSDAKKFFPVHTSFIDCNDLTTDNLGNIYLSDNHKLTKLDSSGFSPKIYSDKTRGAISFVDASNPMRILVFYRDFLQIVFLDNMLAPNGDPIKLNNLGFNQVPLCCNSYRGGFWIYDQGNFELIHFTNELQIDRRSGNILQLTGVTINPQYLIEQNGQLYLNNKDTGVMVFDEFGTYIKTLGIKPMGSIQVGNEEIVFQKNDKIFSYGLKSLLIDSTLLPTDAALRARVYNQRLVLMLENQLNIYQVK